MLPKRKRSWPKAVKAEVFHEFCAGSSIHGVRYFDRTERTACERFWWLVVFLLSMFGCGTMIYKAYVKWDQVPIIVTFSEKTTPVWEVQFPAFTICPETKVSSKHMNFTSEMNVLEGEIDEDFNTTVDAGTIGRIKVVAQLCNMMFHGKYGYLAHLNGTDEHEVVSTLRNISLVGDDVIGICYFGGGQRSCQPFLHDTITEEGLCYSFNMLPQEQIFRQGALHNGSSYMTKWRGLYEDEVSLSVPIQATGSGVQSGLRLYLITKKTDIDYMCTGLTQGYKLMLHESGEYPQVSKRHIRIPLGHEVSIAVKPQMISTSQSAADYHWRKRQCFFNHERHLRYFQIYNQENCELECLTNATLDLCGCVRFSMPRPDGAKVCLLHSWYCMLEVQGLLTQHSNHAETYASECNCLPACSSIQYDVEVTQSSIDLKKFIAANRDIEDRSNEFDISSLDLYFKESHFITSKRSELYGLVDFLANCGGLLGLFMGVSILSLLEICYYITIRPFSVGKKRSEGAPSMDSREKHHHEASNSLLAVVTKVD